MLLPLNSHLTFARARTFDHVSLGRNPPERRAGRSDPGVAAGTVHPVGGAGQLRRTDRASPSLPPRGHGLPYRERRGVLQPPALRDEHGLPRGRGRPARVLALPPRPGRRPAPRAEDRRGREVALRRADGVSPLPPRLDALRNPRPAARRRYAAPDGAGDGNRRGVGTARGTA